MLSWYITQVWFEVHVVNHVLLYRQLHSLLDCAIYFNNKQLQNSANESGSSKNMVTVLLDQSLVESLRGGKVHDGHQEMLQMITDSFQYGIETDTAASFYSKWQHSRQS